MSGRKFTTSANVAHHHNTMTSWAAKVGRFKYIMHYIFSIVSACICGLIIGIIAGQPYLVAGWLIFLDFPETEYAKYVADSPALIVIVVGFASSLYYLCSLANAHFILRVFPPRISGKRRYGVIGFVILQAFFTICYVLYWLNYTPTLPPPNAFTSPMAIKAAVYVTSIVYVLGFVVPLMARHLYPRSFLERPFVLFLRRFSRFSDRAVQSALLKYAPAGKPVAFLTPTGSRPGDWDPFRVGLASDSQHADHSAVYK